MFLVPGFIACVYFSAGKKHTLLHQTFSALLIVTLVHLVFDGATIYTVNHLDTVPAFVNDVLHRLFVGTMVLAVYLFYKYIAVLAEEESGKTRLFDIPAKVFLAVAELGELLLSVRYAVAPSGNYSDGKTAIDQMLLTYAKHPAKLEGNSVGILNVQKRIKLLCGREHGLSYTENPTGGVTVHLLLPMNEEEEK